MEIQYKEQARDLPIMYRRLHAKCHVASWRRGWTGRGPQALGGKSKSPRSFMHRRAAAWCLTGSPDFRKRPALNSIQQAAGSAGQGRSEWPGIYANIASDDAPRSVACVTATDRATEGLAQPVVAPEVSVSQIQEYLQQYAHSSVHQTVQTRVNEAH